VPTYLVDENLPRSLAPSLRAAGFEAEDVRDQGLRGRPDTEVLSHAISRGWVLVTGDLGFGSLIRSVPSFPGLLLIRLPDEWPVWRINEVVKKALSTLASRDLSDCVVTVEPKRLRIHLSKKL
jgi:predicted nuclease of predicted toxin-antitoxin system